MTIRLATFISINGIAFLLYIRFFSAVVHCYFSIFLMGVFSHIFFYCAEEEINWFSLSLIKRYILRTILNASNIMYKERTAFFIEFLFNNILVFIFHIYLWK